MPDNVPLTSPLSTAELPAITPDAVTVTIARVPVVGSSAEFEAALRALVGAASQAPGSLGATVLAPGPLDSEWHTVMRFSDVVALRQWEKCQQRLALLAEVERHTAITTVVTAPSPSAWFAANDVPAQTPVRRRTRDVLWGLPAALTVAAFVTPSLLSQPLVVRAAISAVVGVAATVLVIGPLRQKVRAWRVQKDPLL